MHILPFICLGIYSLFVFWLWLGLSRVVKRDQHLDVASQNLFYSIIIAARNEEKIIGKTIDGLISQEYPTEKYEIILVADRCSDKTVEIVKEKKMRFANLNLIEVKKKPDKISAKKNALQVGIQSSSSKYLILMDADCIPSKYYLQTLNRYFLKGSQVVLNIPKVKYKKNILHDYLLPERLISWSIATAGVGNSTPFLAFGGSWGYTTKILDKVKGFEKIAASLSGDDDLLIYEMGKLKPEMSVCLCPRGWVKTELPNNFKEFFYQRRRHHSAGKYYATKIKMGYLVFHLSNLLLWISPLLFLSGLISLSFKFLLDFFVLKYAAKVFKEPIDLKHVIIFEIGYLGQHFFIAPLGFVGKVKWK